MVHNSRRPGPCPDPRPGLPNQIADRGGRALASWAARPDDGAMDDIDLAGTRVGGSSGGDGKGPERKGRSAVSVIAAVVLTALVVAWVLRNGESVRVDWLLGATEAPLALVIIIAAVLGWVVGSVMMALVRRRRAKAKAG